MNLVFDASARCGPARSVAERCDDARSRARVSRRGRLAAFAGGLVLAACGGGGGGGSGGPDAGDNSWLSFSPTRVEITTYESESVSISVTANSARTIAEPLNAALVDSRGVIEPGAQIVAESALRYRLTLQSALALRAGTYEGSFEVRLCRDNPATCASPYPGSPWQVPYRIVVRPGTNLTPLSRLAGATDWTTYQGNASHTGFVPATLDATAFNRRWAQPMTTSEVAVADGRMAMMTVTDRRWALVVLAEQDGRELWRHDFGELSMVTIPVPAMANGRVYLTLMGPVESAFFSFDAATGARLSREPIASQGYGLLAPTPHGGAVYGMSGGFAGLARFDGASGRQQWFNSEPSLYDLWTPAVNDSQVVAFVSNRLWVIDPATGATRTVLPNPRTAGSPYSMNGAPVLGAGGLVYVTAYGNDFGPDHFVAGSIVAFDTAAGRVAWTQGTRVCSNPVLADGVIYALTQAGELVAHDAASGQALWQLQLEAAADANAPPRRADQPLVVVGRHAFVSGNGITLAVDLQQRRVVWSYPASGRLAVSAQGVLYIAASDERRLGGGAGRLIAVNLR